MNKTKENGEEVEKVDESESLPIVEDVTDEVRGGSPVAVMVKRWEAIGEKDGTVSDVKKTSMVRAIEMGMGSGKSYIARGYSSSFVDVEALLSKEEFEETKVLRREAIKLGGDARHIFAKINEILNKAILRNIEKIGDRIVLVHSRSMLQLSEHKILGSFRVNDQQFLNEMYRRVWCMDTEGANMILRIGAMNRVATAEFCTCTWDGIEATLCGIAGILPQRESVLADKVDSDQETGSVVDTIYNQMVDQLHVRKTKIGEIFNFPEIDDQPTIKDKTKDEVEVKDAVVTGVVTCYDREVPMVSSDKHSPYDSCMRALTYFGLVKAAEARSYVSELKNVWGIPVSVSKRAYEQFLEVFGGIPKLIIEGANAPPRFDIVTLVLQLGLLELDAMTVKRVIMTNAKQSVSTMSCHRELLISARYVWGISGGDGVGGTAKPLIGDADLDGTFHKIAIITGLSTKHNGKRQGVGYLICSPELSLAVRNERDKDKMITMGFEDAQSTRTICVGSLRSLADGRPTGNIVAGFFGCFFVMTDVSISLGSENRYMSKLHQAPHIQSMDMSIEEVHFSLPIVCARDSGTVTRLIVSTLLGYQKFSQPALVGVQTGDLTSFTHPYLKWNGSPLPPYPELTESETHIMFTLCANVFTMSLSTSTDIVGKIISVRMEAQPLYQLTARTLEAVHPKTEAKTSILTEWLYPEGDWLDFEEVLDCVKNVHGEEGVRIVYEIALSAAMRLIMLNHHEKGFVPFSDTLVWQKEVPEWNQTDTIRFVLRELPNIFGGLGRWLKCNALAKDQVGIPRFGRVSAPRPARGSADGWKVEDGDWKKVTSGQRPRFSQPPPHGRGRGGGRAGRGSGPKPDQRRPAPTARISYGKSNSTATK
jgi:hypothetical protein